MSHLEKYTENLASTCALINYFHYLMKLIILNANVKTNEIHKTFNYCYYEHTSYYFTHANARVNFHKNSISHVAELHAFTNLIFL